ncbi:MAG: metallophosphoesterase [Hyphomicrobiaceae bacterium]|jgi:protein phosphatase
MSAAPDQRDEAGPFDIVGDVHGCCDELEMLLTRLGYGVRTSGRNAVKASTERRVIFVGDFIDRGPRSIEVLRIAMAMVEAGQALAVLGNHDVKLMRWLDGRNIQLTHGLAQTVEQMQAEPETFRHQVKAFLESLPYHLWLDDGRLAVAHAGIREDMFGRTSGSVQAFCLYGDTTGEKDELGLPVRRNWAANYRGKAAIIHGHTPLAEAQWQNNTICIDTGCCFGGKLTALRWPERELVSVPAARMYTAPARPLGAGAGLSGGQ